MNVFLTGATGFVGSRILGELVRQGHTVRCLVRKESENLGKEYGATEEVEGGEFGAVEQVEGRKYGTVEQVEGDVTVPTSLRGTMDGCDAVIHLVGIIAEHPSRGITFERIHFGGTRAIVDAAQEASIPRFIHMSANGARTDGVSAYQTSKWKAEEYVQQAKFDHWTIFRPSLIFGDPGPRHPEFASQLARWLVRPLPMLVAFGEGRYEMQPISVGEIASAFVQALTLERANGNRYCAAGQERIAFIELLDRINEAIGHVPKPHFRKPIGLIRPFIRAFDRTGLLPISLDQFDMLVEGNTCDSTAFYRDFDVSFKPFTPKNLSYLNRKRR